MAWLRALLVAILNALVSGALTAYAADVATGVLRVSNFEGGRGMLIAFVLVPAGAIGGFLVGLVAGKVGRYEGGAAAATRLAVAVATSALAIGAVTGLSVLSEPRPLVVDGRLLAVEVEVRVPPGAPAPSEEDFRISLYASDSDNHFAEIRWSETRTEDGRVVVPALAPLNSASASRTLMAGAWPSQVFHLPLPARPGREHEQWSAWARVTQDAKLAAVPDAQAYEVRYRVVPRTFPED